MIPTIDKTYNCFDDGKITISRMYEVKIKEIIPSYKIDVDILNEWRNEVKQCSWLYAKETDYFIKAQHPEEDAHYFVRSVDGGWFSLGWWAARLDVDNSLTQQAFSYE